MISINLLPKKVGMFFIIFVITCGLVAFVVNRNNKPVQLTHFSMGTFFTLTIYGGNAKTAANNAFDEIVRVERLTNSQNGPVAKINQNWGKWVRVPEELFRLIHQTVLLSGKTKGAFQPAIGSLVDLWGFGYGGEGQLPSSNAIAEQVELLKGKSLALKEDTLEVLLAPGCRLDLGGVAKGYAVDRAYQILDQQGIKHALINGGDSSIRALGSRPWGKPWRIALLHPRREEWVGVLQLQQGMAVGTSADTQRFFIKKGRRYSHLINPRTGYPARDVLLVTVTAPTAMAADIYSTAVFVSERKDRVKLMEDWGINGYYISPKSQWYSSKGFQKLLTKK